MAQLDSLLSKGLSKTAVDRPVNVEGCSAACNLRPPSPSPSPHADGFHAARRRKTPPPPAVATDHLQKPSQRPRENKRRRANRPKQGEGCGEDEEHGGVTALSLEELSPPFFGDRPAAASSPPSPSDYRHDDLGLQVLPNESVNANANAMVTARRGPEGFWNGNKPGATSWKNSPLPLLTVSYGFAMRYVL